MHIILSIPDNTYEMTVATNAGTQVFTIDDIHYMRQLFLRNVQKGDSFDRKYRVLKERPIPLDELKLPIRIKKSLIAANINSVHAQLLSVFIQ